MKAGPRMCNRKFVFNTIALLIKTWSGQWQGDGSAGMKKILTIDNILNPEKILQPCMQDKALRHTHDSTKYKKIVNCNHGSPVCNEEARLTSLDTDTDTSARRPTKLVQ